MKFQNLGNNLTFKLSLSIILIIILTSFLISWIVFRESRYFFEKELQKKGLYLTKMLSEQLIEPLLYEERLSAYRIIEAAFTAEPNFFFFSEVYSPEGELFLTLIKDLASQPLNPEILRNTREIQFKNYTDHYEIIAPVIAKNFGIIGYLRLGVSYKTWRDSFEKLKNQVLEILLLVIIMGILIATYITKKVIYPAQGRLIRAEKLSALGQLAAGLAHEIKNPLTSLKMLVQTSLQEDTPLEKRDLQIMEKELNRIDKVVADFLNFSRVNRREWKPIEVTTLIEECAALCKSKFKLSGIELKIELDERKAWVTGDADALKQVFLNLLLNAYESFKERSGKIEIKLKKFEGEVKVYIKDNGSGIPKAIQSKIFDPFFSTKPEGTGMGLAIVYNILKEHQGKINITSEESKGTTVEITLPSEGRMPYEETFNN